MKDKYKLFVFILIFLGIVFSVQITSAESSVSDEMQRVTHYAEEYETGNINYVQLMVYTSAVRESLNELMGVKSREDGGILKQEQLKKILGEPAEETRWVWVEKEEREMKIDEPAPIWKKIVFDGKKIQIRLAAFPSFYKDEIIYRLNFETEFKKPAEQLNVQDRIDDIKILAEKFSSEPSQENGKELAKESVNIERAFESYYRQNGGKCEDVLAGIFGSENKRKAENMIVWEIDFADGDDYTVRARLEMCDDCDWNWINLDMWIEGRGPGFKEMEGESEMSSPDEFRSLEWEEFESKTISLLEDYKEAVNKKEWSRANSLKSKMWALNEAWNQKSNDVWKEMDVVFETKRNGLGEEERRKFDENYGWLKEEQEKRKKVKEIQEQNYQKRKVFYESLFKAYDKKEYYYEKISFEKRLIELFKERGEEICDNNKDDNTNEKIDCEDEQCGGKICGYLNEDAGNESTSEKKELYCIMGTCQVKEEIVLELNESVCGNHVCEFGEMENNCTEDCSLCPMYKSINCSGRVMFSGEDESGCPLEPVCVAEDSCELNEDCEFLCGVGSCIEGKCEVSELAECRESDCSDGQNKIENCGNGEEIIIEFCDEGLWKETDVRCEAGADSNLSEKEIVIEEPIVGDECSTRGDCGGENDVCSNGQCVSLPENAGGEEILDEEIIEEPETEEDAEEPRESPAEEEQTQENSADEEQEETASESEESSSSEPEQTPEPSVTGEIVLNPLKLVSNFFLGLFSKESGITGFSVEEGDDSGSENSGETIESTLQESPPDNNKIDEENGDNNIENGNEENREGEQINREGDWEERRDDGREEENGRDDEKRDEENKKRCEEECGRMCYDNKVRPCVDECIRKDCGESFECDVDSVSKTCEGTCSEEGDVEGCKTDCLPKCAKGGDWWKEFERKPEEDKHKEEKGVFQAGGECRQAQGGKTEGFIWFGGWGEPFEKIQSLKQKYYSGGQADWCKWEFENLKKQRAEFEKGFDEEFLKWFFEKYLANSADEWEQHVSGIFELYWKDVELSKQMTERMNCLGVKEFPEVNLVNVKYESEYGSIEFWEEMKTMKMPEAEEVQVVSPYMKIWIFPSKEVIKLEMKKGMEKHKMPGPEGENEQMGPTDDEKEEMRKDEGAMEMIREISGKYGGSFDGVIQFKDYSTDEVVLNIYVKIDEENLISAEPMLYNEVPSEDARVELDFEILYDIIYTSEKEMRGIQTESPPWDRKKFEPVKKIKEVTNGAKMWLKGRQLMSSAKYYPESAEEDMSFFMKEMLNGMFGGPGEDEPPEEMEENDDDGKGVWEDKKVITGEVISG